MLELGPHQQKLDPIETASRDEIEAVQLSRLKWSLAHAHANVPHYRAAFEAAGVHPSDLKRLEDIRLLYVALTRPVYACYLGLALFSEGNAKHSKLSQSALGYLLGIAEQPTLAQLQQALAQAQHRQAPLQQGGAQMWAPGRTGRPG